MAAVTKDVLKAGTGPAVTTSSRYSAHVTLWVEAPDGSLTPSGWSTRVSDGAAKDAPFAFQPGACREQLFSKLQGQKVQRRAQAQSMHAMSSHCTLPPLLLARSQVSTSSQGGRRACCSWLRASALSCTCPRRRATARRRRAARAEDGTSLATATFALTLRSLASANDLSLEIERVESRGVLVSILARNS